MQNFFDLWYNLVQQINLYYQEILHESLQNTFIINHKIKICNILNDFPANEMIYNGQVKHTVQSLYNTPPYNTDFVITKSCCGHNEMVIFLSISLNLFILQEHLAILLTSTLEINCNLGSFFKQGYRYHKLLKTFPKFY